MFKKCLPNTIKVTVLFFLATAAFSQEVPEKLQAALFVKVLPLYTNLGSGPFAIHVIDSPTIAEQLKTYVGKSVGKATLEAVTEGATPSGTPKVVYFGSNSAGGISFCQDSKVLSITGKPELVNEGVTLGVGIGENGKPKFLLNLSSSKAEGVNWNPAILKVAETIK